MIFSVYSNESYPSHNLHNFQSMSSGTVKNNLSDGNDFRNIVMASENISMFGGFGIECCSCFFNFFFSSLYGFIISFCVFFGTTLQFPVKCKFLEHWNDLFLPCSFKIILILIDLLVFFLHPHHQILVAI